MILGLLLFVSFFPLSLGLPHVVGKVCIELDYNERFWVETADPLPFTRNGFLCGFNGTYFCSKEGSNGPLDGPQFTCIQTGFHRILFELETGWDLRELSVISVDSPPHFRVTGDSEPFFFFQEGRVRAWKSWEESDRMVFQIFDFRLEDLEPKRVKNLPVGHPKSYEQGFPALEKERKPWFKEEKSGRRENLNSLSKRISEELNVASGMYGKLDFFSGKICIKPSPNNSYRWFFVYTAEFSKFPGFQCISQYHLFACYLAREEVQETCWEASFYGVGTSEEFVVLTLDHPSGDIRFRGSFGHIMKLSENRTSFVLEYDSGKETSVQFTLDNVQVHRN